MSLSISDDICSARLKTAHLAMTASVVLATPCEGINFLLSEKELRGLNEMVDYVDTEMKTAEMIRMFS